MTAIIVGAHYLLAFALELALLFAFGLFGVTLAGGGWAGGALALVLVGIAILLWARFAAPKAASRLAGVPLLAFKIVLFAAGTLAFWGARQTEVAIWFGAVSALDLGAAVVLGRV